jgi:hypothetical protein
VSVVISHSVPQLRLDRRSAKRFPAALPVILELGEQRLCAQLIDLAAGGGRLEVSVIPLPHSELRLRCGTIAIRAIVVWSRGNHIGLEFQAMLTDKQIDEQVRRTHALAYRRHARLCSSKSA